MHSIKIIYNEVVIYTLNTLVDLLTVKIGLELEKKTDEVVLCIVCSAALVRFNKLCAHIIYIRILSIHTQRESERGRDRQSMHACVSTPKCVTTRIFCSRRRCRHHCLHYCSAFFFLCTSWKLFRWKMKLLVIFVVRIFHIIFAEKCHNCLFLTFYPFDFNFI